MQNLHNLVGENVRLFRGGPESRDGRLIDLQKDFLTLSTKKDGVVYYHLTHIKSITKNSKDGTKGKLPDNESRETFIKASCFHDLLGKMKHMNVRIDRGGPESRTGRLMDVLSDYLVLNTADEGVIYYKIHHIKSISHEEDIDTPDQKKTPHFVTAENFNELLKKLKYSWIKINRGGPEKIEGILVDNSEDFLILTVGDEVNRIPTFHIRNINCAAHRKDENDDKEQEKGDHDNHDKTDDHDHRKHDDKESHDDADLNVANENWEDDQDPDTEEDRIERYYEEKYENAYEDWGPSTSNRRIWYGKKRR